jgi:hypothetical protein
MDPASIVFGEGVGPFRLGMGISEAVSVLSNDHHRLNFEINFPQPEKVLNEEIIISLLSWGIRLRFQPASQKLYLVDYYDISQRRFSIKGSVFGGGGQANSPVTFEMLHKYLGPTLPGTIVEDEYFLCNFDGASFLFSIPSEHLTEMKSHPHLPVTFNDGSSANLSRVFVYPIDLDIASLDAYPDVLAARVTVVLKNELSPSGNVSVFISAPPGGGKGVCGMVELGMTLQDVISMLGDPAVAGINAQTHSYRYEYPQLGLEFYFSESTHILFQVVLRNNLAHSTDFGRFERCPFRIYYTHPGEAIVNPVLLKLPVVVLAPSNKMLNNSAEAPPASADLDPGSLEINSLTLKTNHKKNKKKKAAKSDNNGDAGEGAGDPSSSSSFDVIYGPSNENAFIDPFTTDVKIRELMSGWFGGSIVTREASAQLPSPKGSPFAETLLYAYPEVV